MERSIMVQRSLWVVTMLIGLMLAACGGPATTVAPAPTEEPTEVVSTIEVTEAPTTEAATEEATTAPPEGKLPCPEGTEPKPVVFGEPAEQEGREIQGLLIVSSGTYTNEIGQPFTITVTGRFEEFVVAYTTALEVCLLAAKPGRQPPEGDDAQVVAQDPEIVREDAELSTQALLDENVENLIIDIELALTADELMEQFRDGYDLLATIHPNINNGVSHNYRQKWRWSATVTTTITGGKVRTRLWANCVTSVYRDTSGSLTLYGKVGYDWFDLAVTGMLNSSSYTLAGAWATYSDTYTVASNPTCGS